MITNCHSSSPLRVSSSPRSRSLLSCRSVGFATTALPLPDYNCSVPVFDYIMLLEASDYGCSGGSAIFRVTGLDPRSNIFCSGSGSGVSISGGVQQVQSDSGFGHLSAVQESTPSLTGPGGRKPLPCVHEGSVVEFCKTCSGELGEAKHVRSCNHEDADWDLCTRSHVSDEAQACVNCPLYETSYLEQYHPIGSRHLSYHVYPRKYTNWRRRLAQVTSRLGLFNGVKVFAVVTDGNSESASEVTALLPSGWDVVVKTFDNVPRLSETLTAGWRLKQILSRADDDDVILYAHAKGVSRPPTGHFWRWGDVLQDTMLDHMSLVEAKLLTHPIVGSLKLTNERGWNGDGDCSWHYAGTHYWIRAGAARRASPEIVQNRHGVESWPGRNFGKDESAVVFPSPVDYLDREGVWESTVEPTYDRWVNENPPSCPENKSISVVVVTPVTRRDNLPRVRASVKRLSAFSVSHSEMESSGDTFGAVERNLLLDLIGPMSWIYFLDDDNVIHPRLACELTTAFRQYPRAVGFIFRQVSKAGRTRLHATIPTKVGTVDVGQFVFRRDAVGGVKFRTGYDCDYHFVREVLAENHGGVVAIDVPCTYYNYLR